MSASPSTIDRLRLVLADYGLVVLVACLLLAGAGGWLVATAQPGTETETVVTDRWSEQGEFTHGAEITEPNPVFETGTVVQRGVYFTRLSPVLEGTYAYQHDDDTPRTVAMDLQLVLQSVRDESVVWRRTEPLNTTERTVESDGQAVSSWRLNVSAAETQIEQIEEQLGASLGTAEVSVIAEVVTTAEDGRTTRHTRRFEVDPSGESFSVSPSEAYGQEYETTTDRTVETDWTLSRALGGVVLVGAGLSGAVALGVGRMRGTLAVPPAKRRRIDAAQTRAEFDEWITTATLPPDLGDQPVVDVETLEGLVDVAIDTNQRVIEDTATSTLWVQTPTTAYRHEPGHATGDAEGDRTDGADETLSLGAIIPTTETPEAADDGSEDRTDGDATGDGQQTNGSEGRERFPE